MPNNLTIVDQVSKNYTVEDRRSQNELVLDIKSKNKLVQTSTEDFVAVEMPLGMSIGPGLWMNYTYPITTLMII